MAWPLCDRRGRTDLGNALGNKDQIARHYSGMAMAAVIVLALVACGGSGGGTRGGFDPSPIDPVVPSPNPTPTLIGGHHFRLPPLARYQVFSDGPVSYALGEIEAIASYSRIGVAYALGQNAAGQGITVAVIDSGIGRNLAEFETAISPSSRSFTGFDYHDAIGHGTAMAGIIGARGNGQGIIGIAPNSQLLILDAYTEGNFTTGLEGGFYIPDIIAAIDYAINNGAQVINLSLGGGAIDYDLADAMDKAAAQDIIVLKATGNSGNDIAPTDEARLIGGGFFGQPSIIAVTAVNADNRIANFAQPCDIADPYYCLAAPGVAILSLQPDGSYAYESGTSHATAMASGSAAALRSYFPELSATDVTEILLQSADDLGAPGVDRVYGSGLINLERALMPLGATRVAASDKALADAGDIASGPFGLGLVGLRQALAAVDIQDAYDRHYMADFGRAVRLRDDHALLDFIRDSYIEWVRVIGTTEAFAFIGAYDRDRDLIFNPYLDWVGFDGGLGLRASGDEWRAIAQFGLAEDQANLYLQLARDFEFGPTKLGVGGSYLYEDGQVLGARFGGNFGTVRANHALGAHASIEQRLVDDWSAYGYGTWTQSAPDFDAGALISDISTIRATAFGLGLSKAGIFGADELRLGIAQPLHVVDGEYRLYDGSRLEMKSDRRAWRAELGYRYELTENLALEGGVFYQNGQGTDDLAFDLGVKMRF